MQKNYEEMTQKYSTFGSKLLQHCDVLNGIQKRKKWKPITVQLSLTSACQFNCCFCSVKNRPQGINIPFKTVQKALTDFKKLGAKALEISGGGEPLLYSQINDVIALAHSLGFEIGLISSYPKPADRLSNDSLKKLAWFRLSLHGLDDNIYPEDYKLSQIPNGIMGFSYIINKETKNKTLKDILALVEKNPSLKFVRIAGDCLEGDNLTSVKKKWGKKIDKINDSGKFFIKEINENYKPFKGFCGVGALRPYCVENGSIYICTSHVLKNRNYDKGYIIGDMNNVKGMYKDINAHFKENGHLYDIDPKKCFHCFYYNNNKILYEITRQIPDKNFA